jgi:hypothetical protein
MEFCANVFSLNGYDPPPTEMLYTQIHTKGIMKIDTDSKCDPLQLSTELTGFQEIGYMH